jgi:hypothetical protein
MAGLLCLGQRRPLPLRKTYARARTWPSQCARGLPASPWLPAKVIIRRIRVAVVVDALGRAVSPWLMDRIRRVVGGKRWLRRRRLTRDWPSARGVALPLVNFAKVNDR